jgi:hypothetical protein
MAESQERLLSMVMEALERLPDAQRRRLAAESPDTITLALTSALAALAGKGARTSRKRVGSRRAPRILSATEATRRLDARTRALDPHAPDLLGSDDFARAMGLKTRQSVLDRLARNLIVGWRAGNGSYRFPLAQLDDRGRPPEGLDKLLPLFEDGHQAWAWLTTPMANLGDRTPLERLRDTDLDAVMKAAQADAQGDFL